MTTTLKHTPTDEQQAVIEAIGGQSSVMVDALAGCAKSSTLEMAAPRVRVPALALAFNKRIASELAPRLPGNFATKTFNGLGHGALSRGLGNAKLDLDERKLGKIITQVGRDWKMELSQEAWDNIRQLVTGVMQAGITPGNRGRPMAQDTPENWECIADDRWIGREDFEQIYELSREVLAESIRQTEAGRITFDDQIYYPTVISGQFPQYPVVFVDEKQDLNPLNIQMLGLCLRPDGRLAAVGDDRQSIYAFRGADTEASRKIRGLRPETSWADRSLLTTFRCPKLVVERQQRHAPGYRAWHTNPDGAVAHLRPGAPGFDLAEGWNWKTIQRLAPRDGCKITVLCRNNGPLLSMAFKLIRQQIGVVMVGRDIGKNLVQLSRKILPDDALGRLDCSSRVAAWIDDECALARANGHPERIASITDRGECLMAVLDSSCRDAGELRQMLQRLFARDTGQVELSSIHRYKGLETDCVLHLDPWRIPSKFARQEAEAGDPRALQQEWNLKYVAETRTRHTLITANLEDFNG